MPPKLFALSPHVLPGRVRSSCRETRRDVSNAAGKEMAALLLNEIRKGGEGREKWEGKGGEIVRRGARVSRTGVTDSFLAALSVRSLSLGPRRGSSHPPARAFPLERDIGESV